MIQITTEVKKEFDFGWKKWDEPPPYAWLALEHQRGDILDIGCGTCQLYLFLRGNHWDGDYYGVDTQEYDNFEYPPGVQLIIGDACRVQLPIVDTVILYNVLEHVQNPVDLLKQAIASSKKNVLINVPKRNEQLWRHGIAEYHQLDKTHSHCGFSREELYHLVHINGAEIIAYEELRPINAAYSAALWKSRIPKVIVYLLLKAFKSDIFYNEIWCEITGRGRGR